MRKMTLFVMMALSVLLAGNVHAQKPGTMGGKMTPHPMPMKGATVSYTGMVKGAPTGGSFTLAMKAKTVTVMMAKGGRARDKATGKFIGVNNIQPGSSVTAVGALAGTTLTAKTVTVNSAPGGKMAPKKGMNKMMPKMSK